MKKTTVLLTLGMFVLGAFICGCSTDNTSDDKQQAAQEQLLSEATSQTGMPAIKNFRERKILKDILELRDQEGLVTYTYLENEIPHVVPGKTALAGKLTYMGESVGYGIPYATQYTNPQKAVYHSNIGWVTLPQADPNALFSPASAEGTWVLLKDPNGSDTKPVYVEPRIVCSPFKLQSD